MTSRTFIHLFLLIVAAVAVFVLFSCKKSFEETIQDTFPPTVEAINPGNNSIDFPTANSVSVTFIEEINPTTVTTDSFKLSQTEILLPGSVTADKKVVTFTPDSALEKATTYTAIITTAFKDTSQNTLEKSYSWSFETTRQPTVIKVTPTDSIENVVLNPEIKIVFSEEMDSNSLNTETIVLSANGQNASGTVTYADRKAMFSPSSNLVEWTNYTAVVTTGVKDLAGNQMEEDFAWTFKTTDDTAPEVSSISPANNATGVALNTPLTIVFNDYMDLTTITTASIMLTQSGNIVDGTVAYSDKSAVFTPDQDLTKERKYLIAIKTGAKNEAGISLQTDINSSFVTIDTTAPTNPSISINSGDSTTDSTSVTLHLSAADGAGVTAYHVSETSTTPAATAAGWITVSSTNSYSADISFDLSSSVGSKTVYVWFKDATGNVSESANASIALTIVTTVDTATNLMWQDNSYISRHNWDSAVNYCNNLELANHPDWRLPSKDELSGLYNRRHILNSYEPYYYWSSTTDASDTDYAWDMGFDDGSVFNSPKSDNDNVRCVRGDLGTVSTTLVPGDTLTEVTRSNWKAICKTWVGDLCTDAFLMPLNSVSGPTQYHDGELSDYLNVWYGADADSSTEYNNIASLFCYVATGSTAHSDIESLSTYRSDSSGFSKAKRIFFYRHCWDWSSGSQACAPEGIVTYIPDFDPSSTWDANLVFDFNDDSVATWTRNSQAVSCSLWKE